MDSYLGGLSSRLHKRGVWESLTLLSLSDDFKVYQREWERAVKAGESPYAAFYRVFTGRSDVQHPPSGSVAGRPLQEAYSPRSPEGEPGRQGNPPGQEGLPDVCGGSPGG